MSQSRSRKTKSTIFLSSEHRKLVRESGKTIQKFFEDIVDFCEKRDMLSWKDGQCFFRRARIVMTTSEFLNDIYDALPDPYHTGRKLGEKARRAYIALWDLDPSKPNPRKSYFSCIAPSFGWGTVTEQSPNKILCRSPPTKNEPFMRGFLEGILSMKLRTIHHGSDQIVFEIQNIGETEATSSS